MPLYTLEIANNKVSLNTQCAEAWIARPPEIFGVARAFAFRANANDVNAYFSKEAHVYTHPTRSLTPHCQMLAIDAKDGAWIGRFKGWKSDEFGHPKSLEMAVFEKGENGFQEKTIEIERSQLKASYRIVGAMEAA